MRLILNYILIMKMYWNRCMGHLGLPLAIFEKIALLTLLLQSFNIFNWITLTIATIIMTFGFIIIGWIDVKYGIYAQEISLNNKYNPELKLLVKNARQRK